MLPLGKLAVSRSVPGATSKPVMCGESLFCIRTFNASATVEAAGADGLTVL